MTATVLEGDCREVLRTLPARSVQCAVTSPPYFGLRDYGADGQIGLEPTPDEYVAALVEVFREVRRVLRDDGTVWLNLGDSYAGGAGGRGDYDRNKATMGGHAGRPSTKHNGARIARGMGDAKPKDLLGVPWLVAFALRADGWYLRSDVVWSKPNPMPESVTDRPARSHEYVFLLSKGPRYFYDADAIREGDSGKPSGNGFVRDHRLTYQNADGSGRGNPEEWTPGGGRNKRSVWTVATQPFSSERLGLGETDHFAVFPPKLIEPCVLAGSSPRACGVCGAPWRRVVEKGRVVSTGGSATGARASNMDAVSPLGQNPLSGAYNTGAFVQREHVTVGWESGCEHDDDTGRSVVLDPFNGSGTVGVGCGWHGRDYIGIELNPSYAAMARERIALEGRPGGRPAHHEPARVNGHPSLFDLGGEAA